MHEEPVAEYYVDSGETVLNIHPISRLVDFSEKDEPSREEE